MNIDLSNVTLPESMINLFNTIQNEINNIQPSGSDAPVWQ